MVVAGAGFNSAYIHRTNVYYPYPALIETLDSIKIPLFDPVVFSVYTQVLKLQKDYDDYSHRCPSKT